MVSGIKKNGTLQPLAWRLFGALVLGALLAKWAWLLLTPHTPSIIPTTDQAASAEAGKLFGVAAAVIAPAPVLRGAETTILPNIRLTGIFAAKPGRSSFAVLKLDDKRQVGVTTGQEVQPGIRLRAIHPGYILLEKNGVQQRVNLEESRKDAMGKPDAATFSPPAATNQAPAVRHVAPPAANSAASTAPVVKSTPPATFRPYRPGLPWKDQD